MVDSQPLKALEDESSPDPSNSLGAAPAAPPPLTDAYHKVRKQFGLFSGLLIAWELIGVDLEKFSPYNVQLKNPEAAPYVL